MTGRVFLFKDGKSGIMEQQVAYFMLRYGKVKIPNFFKESLLDERCVSMYHVPQGDKMCMYKCRIYIQLQKVWLNLLSTLMFFDEVGYVYFITTKFSQLPLFHESRVYATLIKTFTSSYNSINKSRK